MNRGKATDADRGLLGLGSEAEGGSRLLVAGVGDLIKVSVKRGTPDTRRHMFNAVVIRQRRPFRRVDGTWVQFEDNACVITNEKGDVQGSDIKGPVSREAAERWPRIAATAKQIV